MANIRIDTDGLQNNISSMRAYVNELDSLNARTQSLLAQIASSWEGEASTAYINIMTERMQKAGQMKELLQEFLSYMEDARTKICFKRSGRCKCYQGMLGDEKMIIDVNPQTITEIAQTIANAYGEVEEAARILTSITEHNNWNCKERDAINDYTQSNAREILKISEKSGNFANVMKTVAENFTTDEKNISEMFTSVESMIGSILSIRPIGAGNRTSNLPEGNADLQIRRTRRF